MPQHSGKQPRSGSLTAELIKVKKELEQEKKKRAKAEAEKNKLQTQVAILAAQPSPWVDPAALLLIAIFEGLRTQGPEIYQPALLMANMVVLISIGYDALRSWLTKLRR